MREALLPATPWVRRTLAVIVAVQVALVFAASRGSFFTWDDYPNFIHALDLGLSPAYLFRPATTIEFLAPAHRLGNWLLQRVAPLNFGVALGLLLACLATSTVLLWRVLDRLSGGAWWALVPTATFGASVVMVTATQWWAAGLHSLPAAALSLLAILGWLRWSDERSRGALAVAVLAVAVGTLFYAKVILVPVELVALELLVLRPAAGLRDAWRALWARRGEWALLFAPVAVYLAAYAASGYRAAGRLPSAALVQTYVPQAWLRGAIPALANVRVTAQTADWPHELGIVAAQVVVVALVVSSVRRDRRAWRGWAFLALVFLAHLAVHGRYRLGQVGPLLAYELRYYVELAYLLPIAVVGAFRPGPVPAAAAGSRVPAPPRGPAAVAVVAVAVHLALFGVAAQESAEDWTGYRARGWMTNAMTGVETLRAQGIEPGVLDGVVPEYVAPSWMGRYSFASQVFRTFAPELQVNPATGPLFVLAPDGTLAAAQVAQLADVADPAARAHVQVTGAQPAPGGPLCLRTGQEPASLAYRPPAALQGQRLALRPDIRTDPPSNLTLQVDRGEGEQPALLDPDATGGDRLVDLVTPTLTALRLELPPSTTTCVESLGIVTVTTAG